MDNVDNLRQELITKYGFNDGTRMAMVVVPGVLKDFERKLEKSLVGAEVSEEYIFDDRDGGIRVYGCRMPGDMHKITRMELL